MSTVRSANSTMRSGSNGHRWNAQLALLQVANKSHELQKSALTVCGVLGHIALELVGRQLVAALVERRGHLAKIESATTITVGVQEVHLHGIEPLEKPAERVPVQLACASTIEGVNEQLGGGGTNRPASIGAVTWEGESGELRDGD